MDFGLRDTTAVVGVISDTHGLVRPEVLYVNPGSAGPRRFRFPIAVARLRIDAGQVGGEAIELGA